MAESTLSALSEALAHVPPGALDFEPVPVRSRRDGWTPERQRAFVETVAAGLAIAGAARAVGMSRKGAYLLRERPGAESFAAAWDRALEFSRAARSPAGPTAWQRAVEGILVPLRGGGGRILCWRRKYCNRTLAAMLSAQYRLRGTFG